MATSCAKSVYPDLQGLRFAKRLPLCLFLTAALSVTGPVDDAFAFEWFGKKLFQGAEPEVVVVDPLNYSVKTAINGLEPDQKDTLEAASILIADSERPVSGSLGLLTKARSDRDNLIGALYEQARYSALVNIYIQGLDVEDIPPTSEFSESGPPGTPVPVTINVRAGKQFRFGQVRLIGDGGLDLADFGIRKNETAFSGLIITAQDDIVNRLKSDGYPLAQISDSIIEANHENGTLDVIIRYSSGPRAPLGSASVRGAEKVNPEFIRQQAMIESGETYSPQKLADARKRLLDLGVFEAVTVAEGDSLDENGQVPVIIEVRERKMRFFGLGATYSNADGAGVEAYWGHRNLFGNGEKLRIEGAINRIGENEDLQKLNYSTAILFEKPGAFGPNASFTANARAVSENYDAFERRSVRGGFGINYKIDDKQTLSAALDADWSTITRAKIETRHLIFSTPLEYTYDGSDNRLDPTKGIRFSAFLEPALDLESSASFVKGKLTGSAYFTPDNADYVTFAARASVGSIAGADLAMIPADRRFYAGGGGSIRGFAYQAVGPRNERGRLIGGRSIVETSFEARMQITEKLGIVPFIDAGSVSVSPTPDLSDLRFGAGVGLRYKTPFGPLRLDVGVPLERRKGEDSWAIYAGIGQAF